MQLKIAELFLLGFIKKKNDKLLLEQEQISNNKVTVSWKWDDMPVIPDGHNHQ